MAYIWEDHPERKTFRQGKNVSPYLEVMSPGGSEGVSLVNPLLRFAGIFDALAPLNMIHDLMGTPTEEMPLVTFHMPDIENVLFHYLASLDRIRGIDAKQIRVDALERSILAGDFGPFEQAHWNELTERDRRVILHTLADKYACETVDNFFFLAVQKLFDHVSLIFEKDTGSYYLYISDHKTDHRDTLMKIVTQLFWDIRHKLEIIWHYHYGIIGNDDTMRTSEICIL